MNDESRLVIHYNSASQGLIEIGLMAHPHLSRTVAKLRRENGDSRTIAAMDAKLAELDAMPDDAARIAATTPDNPRAVAGGNNPPVPKGFEAISKTIEDLYDEAKNWLDGQAIANQAQADEVSRLKRMMQEAEKAADEERKRENEPFDTGKAAVQAKYAPLISDTKTAPKGLTVRAVAACDAALTPWLKKLDDEHQARLAAAREAEAKAIESVQTIAAVADTSRLDDADVVDEAVQVAKAAIREVSSLEKDRARVGGGAYRATLLKDNWTATLTDGDAALAHYWKMQRGALEAFLVEMAGREVRQSAGRAIPGFTVENQKRAA